MAAATNQAEIPELLQTVRMVKERLGVRTVLGVSNVSFGMPQRNLVNSVFLAAAFSAGLDMPILNPLSARYRDTVAAFRVLNGQDSGAQNFVQQYSQAVDPYMAPAGALDAATTAQAQPAAAAQHECPIEVPPAFASDRALVEQVCAYVLSGRGAPMTAATEQLLASHASLDIVNGIFVPILDVVGIKYDTGEFFLPQLMASAEAVKVGFDVVRSRMASDVQSTASPASERKIIVATVEGDIHDIGKNIVKMLLENYGFTVIDLGRDVPPQKIVDAAREQNVGLVGLSALMTTTVKAMEQTIALLHAQLPHVQTFVGGAVLTPEYAAQINATYYAKDAAESARIATKFFEAQENAEGA
jgi:5-methyltetrahydrofolate--homocysteine methyltransferase